MSYCECLLYWVNLKKSKFYFYSQFKCQLNLIQIKTDISIVHDYFWNNFATAQELSHKNLLEFLRYCFVKIPFKNISKLLLCHFVCVEKQQLIWIKQGWLWHYFGALVWRLNVIIRAAMCHWKETLIWCVYAIKSGLRIRILLIVCVGAIFFLCECVCMPNSLKINIFWLEVRAPRGESLKFRV